MKKEIIYYTLALFFGNILCYIFFNIKILSLAIFLVVTVIMILTLSKKHFFIWTGFLIIGFLGFHNFFNINLKGDKFLMRVVNVSTPRVTLSFKGREVYIYDFTKSMKEGEKLVLTGDFKKNITYEKGAIGALENHKIISREEDILTKVYNFRKVIKSKFQDALGESRGALLSGVAFGDLKGMDSEDMEDFKALGIIHSISISGFHLNLVYFTLKRFLGTKPSIIISLIYVIFTGAKVSSLRAFIMILFLVLSTKVYKKYNGVTILAFSALLLMFYRPHYSLNMSFHLSFLSTLGILLYMDKLTKILYKLPKCLNTPLSITLSAQILTYPYVAIALNYFTIGFIMGNLLITPIISLLIILGNAAIIFYPIPIVFDSILYMARIIIIFMERVSEILVKINPNGLYVDYKYGVIYTLLIISFYLYFKGYKNMKYLPIAIVLSGVFWIYSIFPTITVRTISSDTVYFINYKFSRVFISEKEIKDYYLKNKLKYGNLIESKEEKYKVNFNKTYDIVIKNKKIYVYKKKDLHYETVLEDGVVLKILPNNIVKIGG